MDGQTERKTFFPFADDRPDTIEEPAKAAQAGVEDEKPVDAANREVERNNLQLEDYPDPDYAEIGKIAAGGSSWHAPNIHRVMRGDEYTGVYYNRNEDKWVVGPTAEKFDWLEEALKNVPAEFYDHDARIAKAQREAEEMGYHLGNNDGHGAYEVLTQAGGKTCVDYLVETGKWRAILPGRPERKDNMWFKDSLERALAEISQATIEDESIAT